MKLVICIINSRDKSKLGEALLESGFTHTVIGSTGGFLKQGNATFLLGLEEEKIEALLEVIRNNCQTREEIVNPVPMEGSLAGVFISTPITVRIGGATIFILDIERFERV